MYQTVSSAHHHTNHTKIIHLLQIFRGEFRQKIVLNTSFEVFPKFSLSERCLQTNATDAATSKNILQDQNKLNARR